MIGIRWTFGDVSRRGCEALRLSVWGARRVFGAAAEYAICLNSLDLDEARARVGALPEGVAWVRSDGRIPDFLRGHLDAGLAEGVAWKFAPLRLFPDRHELALDNDCILWAMPEGVRTWLEDPAGCLLAEDVVPALGQFGPVVGELARNTGMRGLPPGFDPKAALAAVLRAHPVRLASELDEQGLQVAALTRDGGHVVGLEDVAICSPFPPHAAQMGRCGAHFVGLNVKRERPYCDRAAMERIAAFWDARIAAIERAVFSFQAPQPAMAGPGDRTGGNRGDPPGVPLTACPHGGAGRFSGERESAHGEEESRSRRRRRQGEGPHGRRPADRRSGRWQAGRQRADP